SRTAVAQQQPIAAQLKAQLLRQFSHPRPIGGTGVVKRVRIADAREVIITRIRVAALAIRQLAADRVIVVSLNTSDIRLPEHRENAIGMRTKGTQVAETKARFYAA